MAEKELEKKLRDTVKKWGGIAIKFYTIFFAGFPDRIILMPGGRIWFAEIKTEGKKPTARQLIVHTLLRKLGFTVFVIDSSEVLDVVLMIIKPTDVI